MSRLMARWSALDGRSRLAAGAVTVAAIALVAGLAAYAVAPRGTPPVALATPSPTAPPTATLSPSPSASLPAPSPSAGPTPSPSGPDSLLGTDGRLTILLLGSDYRPAHPGNRTDAIMVVSLDPSTGKSAAFSVPRDTVNFPLPEGGVFREKVNALFAYYGKRDGKGGPDLMKAVSQAFGIEIDHYVFIGFSGVQRLVAAVGGVDVTLDQPYYDPEYWVNANHRGWGLPAGTSHLNAQDALIFARSRKGDNDFGRARRQQMLVMAAIDRVRQRGGVDIPTLLQIARDTVRTDLPLARWADLYSLISTIKLDQSERVVFGPRTYADGIGGTSFALRLADCRRWIADHFPPARPGARWPEPSPSPSGSGTTGASPGVGGAAPSPTAGSSTSSY